jgi:translation initiation factor 2 alpha subunit (eIF-2alpha)
MMTVAKEMNNGVALLLERMKTHPEEFVPNNGSSKWGSLISAYKEFLEPEDKQALTEGVNKLLQQAFTEKVLEELVDPKSSLDGLLKAKRNATHLAGVTHVQSTLKALGVGSTVVSVTPSEKPKTIFGRLFNYQ